MNHKSLDILTAINTRRSIRKYKDVAVSDEQIKIILHAGMAAPSAHNRRPFHFVVITDKKIKNELSNKSLFGKMMNNAPVVIAVCGDVLKQPIHDFLIQDCSAAIENMLLAIHGIGLGAVWIGVYNLGGWQKFIKKSLSLPINISPIALISLGVPDEDKPIKNRYEESKVHHNKW
jgi:nitroreductase